MKRMILALLCVISIGCLVGCSKEKVREVKWDHGVVSSYGKAPNVDVYSGYTAAKKGDNYKATYYICEGGPSECPHNVVGVAPSNMTKFNNGSKYYLAYLSSVLYMFYPDGDTWYEAEVVSTSETEQLSEGQLASIAYEVLSNIKLYSATDKIVINDAVEVNAEFYEYAITAECVDVKGYFRAGDNTGGVTMTGSIEVGKDKTVGTASTGKKDYYLYKDVLIEAEAGIDIMSMVTFL